MQLGLSTSFCPLPAEEFAPTIEKKYSVLITRAGVASSQVGLPLLLSYTFMSSDIVISLCQLCHNLEPLHQHISQGITTGYHFLLVRATQFSLLVAVRIRRLFLAILQYHASAKTQLFCISFAFL